MASCSTWNWNRKQSKKRLRSLCLLCWWIRTTVWQWRLSTKNAWDVWCNGRGFGLSINLTKTRVLYQPPPGQTYSSSSMTLNAWALKQRAALQLPWEHSVAKKSRNVLPLLQMPLAGSKPNCGLGLEWAAAHSARVWRSFCTLQIHTSRDTTWKNPVSSPQICPWNKMVRSCLQGADAQKGRIPSIEALTIERQLRWVGHIMRMERSRLFKAVFYGELRHGNPPVRQPYRIV